MHGGGVVKTPDGANLFGAVETGDWYSMSLTKNVHWNQSIVVISLAKNMR